MVKVIRTGVYYLENRIVKEAQAFMTSDKKEKAVKNTLSYGVLRSHDSGRGEGLRLRFDALISHDITYVGVVQTAKASGMKKFPLPYILTNCHNSLCAVGGTVNGDDHAFGLSAAKKYGGDFVPPHLAVIHQYARECVAKSGGAVLGSDSHTRYGALGCLGVGEGGPELVKQLLGEPYELPRPQIVAVFLKGKLRKGVGPQDVALALIRAVWKNGFAKNKILEFFGPGLKNLSMDYRNGIDTMTTETACLSTLWATDGETEAYFRAHGREKDFKRMEPVQPAYYDGGITVDLSRVEPMIALPFHPSNVYTIREFLERPAEILRKVEEEGKKLLPSFSLGAKIRDGKVYIDQAIVAGCAGGSYENLAEAAEILRGGAVSPSLSFHLYPASMPVWKALAENGYAEALAETGAVVRTAFCGPCFGAGDIPGCGGLSIRHVTRNFENREGSRPAEGQLAAVALMDARSIAATVRNGGALTSALGLEYNKRIKKYRFDGTVYERAVYRGAGKPDPGAELVYGPNIADFPEQIALPENLLIKVVSRLDDPVTTTDELIPSGEIASYRSNPERLAAFALSRKDPFYVARAKEVRALEAERRKTGALPEAVRAEIKGLEVAENTALGSVVVSKKPGDGSAREQAASCQRVLGGVANICKEYATKRYRTNLINWGILPFTCEKPDFSVGDYLYLEGIGEAVTHGEERVVAKVLSGGKVRSVALSLGELNGRERAVLRAGCLVNYTREK